MYKICSSLLFYFQKNICVVSNKAKNIDLLIARLLGYKVDVTTEV